MNFVFDNKELTPAQRVLWRHVKALFSFDTNDDITPLVYQGPVIGSEFITYLATKLYIGFFVEFNTTSIAAGAAVSAAVEFYNELDALMYSASNNSAYADAKFVPNSTLISDVWFSRIAVTNLGYMRFIGYRLDKIA